MDSTPRAAHNRPENRSAGGSAVEPNLGEIDMMRLLTLLLFVLAGGAAYLLFLPVPINPVSWTPPPLDLAPYPPNERLKPAERLAKDAGKGPEGLALDRAGNLYAGYDDGRVLRFDADGGNAKELANTAGRPLGLAVAPNGDVYVADAMRGLMRISPDGLATVLSVEAEGVPFKFVDDVDVTADGSKLYFSDASSRFGFHEVMADVFEHAPNGRVLEFDVASGQTRVLMRDLHFANGVTMGPGDEYLLVNDMNKYRVLRHWLRGDKAGTTEVFIDNLPGFPDNINFNGRDRFWLALVTPRIPMIDSTLPSPQLRKVLFRLPAFMHPAPAMHGWVLGLDIDGKVVADLQHASPDAYAPITSVVQSGDSLYLGSLTAPAIGRLSLAAITN